MIFHLGCCTVVIAVDETKDRPAYIIRSGDQLLITVVGHEKELIDLTVVRPDGMITYPMVGDIKAAGLTIVQLNSAISKKLSALGYYEDPQVTVQLREPSQELIYISGDVEEPGQKSFPEAANVIEALSAAGWFKETADLANAKIVRKRKEAAPEIIPVNLEKLLKRDIIDQGLVTDQLLDDRFMLSNGDVLIIPSALKEDRINVIGHVHQPGKYQVESEVNVIEALALAGGALEDSADLKHIKVIKTDGSLVTIDATRLWSETGKGQRSSDLPSHQNKNNPSLVHGDNEQAARSTLVQPGDSLFIPERGKVNVVGSVKNQGQFPVDGEISIFEALALAGFDEDANLKKLKIIRSTGEQVIVDASKIWKQQEQEYYERLAPGDTLIVPSAMKINWRDISTIVLIFTTLFALFR